MNFQLDDTICAIATAPGSAARGMVRVSGPAAVRIAEQLFESADCASIDSITCATALPGRVRIDLDGSLREFPCDLFLWPTNRSYTRQPVAELHTIGSPPLLNSLLSAVCGAGARLAEPGEFTLRAFLAGRLDLTQAEAVLGVIDARGTEDLDAALVQLAGGLTRPLHQLRDELLQLLAELEAGLDFVEEDIEFVTASELMERLELASELLGGVAAQMASRHVARGTMEIALVGPPNVGKSSLFNAMVQRSAGNVAPRINSAPPALVSPQRGTTRDYLVATISLNGLECKLVDTAGVDVLLREHGTNLPTVEATAQSLATEQCNRAMIRAYCIEATGAADDGPLPDDCDIVVLTKADRLTHRDLSAQRRRGLPVALTSSHTGEGLDELCDSFRTLLARDESALRGQIVSATADRCRESIRLAENSLTAAADAARVEAGNEIVAVELRIALAELGKVVGTVYTDDLLDRIFQTFCIGK